MTRTLFTTADPFCARLAGFDAATEPGCDGGFSAELDLSDDTPSLILTLSDGEVVGLAAIRQLSDAAMSAERLIRAATQSR